MSLLSRLSVLVIVVLVSLGGVTRAATRPAGGTPVCGDDATAALKLAAAKEAGATLERSAGAVKVTVPARPENAWGVQLLAVSEKPVAKDDVLFVRFQMRTVATRAESGEGLAVVVFDETKTPYTRSLDTQFSAGSEWREFAVGFKAKRNFAPGEGRLALQLGLAAQTLEVRDVEVVNYAGTVPLAKLPFVRLTYAGREPDAAWRKAADERIEKLRKGDLAIEVVDRAGKPVPAADVSVKMKRHAFGFGSAVVAAGLAGEDTPDNLKYREIVEANFSRVVFENDLKWQGWDNLAKRPQTLAAVKWLEDRNIEIRGHCLVWPSWKYTPKTLAALKDDPVALRLRVREHITEQVSALSGRILEWDVINEVYANHDLVDILGKDEMVEWFKLARAADPRPVLYINDYSILSANGTDTKHQDAYEQTIKFLKDSGAPIGGIGMQSHFGGQPTPPERMLKILDRYEKLGLAIQSTEFDIRTRDEALQGDFTRDFLTVMFSHPAATGVLMWGFWEGRHWIPEAALYRKDWSIKPNGQAWLDLVKKKWWTDASIRTDAAGLASIRGFCGQYEITAGGKTVKASLPREGAKVRIELD